MDQDLSKKDTLERRPDFRLVLARLENAIISGKDTARCRSLLTRRDLWLKLTPERQLEWARLSQMAGEVELALRILGHLNKTCPSLEAAWTAHLELLSILDRRRGMARVAAAARKRLGENHPVMRVFLQEKGKYIEEGVEDTALGPFVEIRRRQDRIQLFLDLFGGREDCFARQWVDKEEGKQGYVPVRRPMAERDVEEHLSGKKTYGIYLMRSDSTVKTAVIDADISKKFRKGRLGSEERRHILRERSYLFKRVAELSREAGLHPVAEFSGAKGYHFWFFFESPIAAATVRAALEGITGALSKDLSAFELEVFPKQDSLSGKGLGNLVKLPLGVHRLTGKRSYFMECTDRNLETQLDFLGRIEKTPPDEIDASPAGRNPARVLIHPKMREWAEQYPELMTLESHCAPVGQVIALCRNGTQPSLKEEKVLFQTIGFLPRAKSLLHHLLSPSPDYNPHLVDYKLSRLRGKPLGCKRIHSLMQYTGDICPFRRAAPYAHPLLHLDQWNDEEEDGRSEKINDLASALENLKAAIRRTEAFLK